MGHFMDLGNTKRMLGMLATAVLQQGSIPARSTINLNNAPKLLEAT